MNIFERQPVEDPAHLSSHVQLVMSRYVRELVKGRKQGWEDGKFPDRPMFRQADTVLKGLREGLAPRAVYHAFHFAMFVKAEILRPEYELWCDDDPRKTICTVDDTIIACLRRRSVPGLDWDPIDWPCHFGFAQARQLLWSAMQEVRCTGFQSSSNHCSHKRNLPFLEKLQKEAPQEIRSNVMLAVGRQLPAELADAVYEYALSAEKIPVDPSVEERRDTEGEYMIPQLEYQIKEKYRCSRLDEYDRIVSMSWRDWPEHLCYPDDNGISVCLEDIIILSMGYFRRPAPAPAPFHPAPIHHRIWGEVPGGATSTGLQLPS